MKTIAILGGGDWADASVEHVLVPDDTTIETLHDEYVTWLRCRDKSEEKFLLFYDWLINRGIEEADIEEFWE